MKWEKHLSTEGTENTEWGRQVFFRGFRVFRGQGFKVDVFLCISWIGFSR